MGDLGWVGLGLVAALGAAGVTIFGRLGLGNVDVLLASTLRSLVMTLALLVAATARGSWATMAARDTALDARAWIFVLLAGLCGAGSWLAYFGALRAGPAGPVASLDRLSLPLIFVVGALTLGERPGLRAWAGLALILAGTYLIVSDPVSRATA